MQADRTIEISVKDGTGLDETARGASFFLEIAKNMWSVLWIR